jgi:hypothetical protein
LGAQSRKFSGIKKALLELLTLMGVTLTDTAKAELSGAGSHKRKQMNAVHSKRASRGSGNLLTHQRADNCFGRSVFRLRLHTQPRGGQAIYKNNVPLVSRKKPAFPITGKFRRVFGVVFIQRVIFFISQIRHRFLLQVKQTTKRIRAFHSMKHLDSLFIKNIIHNFQQMSITVKPYQQMLFRVVRKRVIVFPVQYSTPDIRFTYPMLKRGRNTFNDNFHTFQYTAPAGAGQGSRRMKPYPATSAVKPFHLRLSIPASSVTSVLPPTTAAAIIIWTQGCQALCFGYSPVYL